MVNEQKIKGDYAMKCECGELIQIDAKYIHLLFEDENPMTGDCPECNRSLIISRNDLGKTVRPLYKGKFKVHWGND